MKYEKERKKERKKERMICQVQIKTHLFRGLQFAPPSPSEPVLTQIHRLDLHNTNMYTYTHIHTHTYTHTYIHTHIHTYTHIPYYTPQFIHSPFILSTAHINSPHHYIHYRIQSGWLPWQQQTPCSMHFFR